MHTWVHSASHSALHRRAVNVKLTVVSNVHNYVNPTTAVNYYVLRAPRYPRVRPSGGSRYHGTEYPTGPGRRRRDLARGHHPGATLHPDRRDMRRFARDTQPVQDRVREVAVAPGGALEDS